MLISDWFGKEDMSGRIVVPLEILIFWKSVLQYSSQVII